MGWATFWAIFSQTHLVTLWQGGETMPAQQAVHIHTMVCICTACWTTCGELQNVTPTSVTLAPRGELSPLGVKIPLFAPLPICLKGWTFRPGTNLTLGTNPRCWKPAAVWDQQKKTFCLKGTLSLNSTTAAAVSFRRLRYMSGWPDWTNFRRSIGRLDYFRPFFEN
jgi:hypothetical protein